MDLVQSLKIFGLKIGHIFLKSLKPLCSKIKIFSVCLSLKIEGSDKKAK